MKRCPICRQYVVWKDSPYRPFCSERCKMIDLDNWLEGRYRVSSPVEPEDEISADDPRAGAKENRE